MLVCRSEEKKEKKSKREGVLAGTSQQERGLCPLK
jgi:hypothetical protein